VNPTLRDRIVRHLEPLPDERAYQVLDYIEFLEAKYGTPAAQASSIFQRFTEGVEDTLRAGRVSTTAIAETVGLLNKAMGVLSGVAAAGKSVASDIVDVASRATASASSMISGEPGQSPNEQPAGSPPPMSPPPPPPQASTPPPRSVPPGESPGRVGN
jgi:hypothetical protein